MSLILLFISQLAFSQLHYSVVASYIKNENVFPLARPYSKHETELDGKDLTYSFNRISQREYPAFVLKKRAKHLILGGCSYIFGRGLNDHETLGFQLQAKAKFTNVYNLAYPGVGPQFSINMLENIDLKESIKEEQGDFIFFLLPFHLNRWFLRVSYLSWVQTDSPYYGLVNNQIQMKGRLKDLWSIKLALFFEKFNLASKYFAIYQFIEGESEFSDDEVKEFAKVFSYMKSLYLKQYPQGHFKLALHPLGHGFFYEKDSSLKPRLVKALKKEGLELIDLNHEIDKWLHDRKLSFFDFFISNDDKHPSMIFNQFLTERLQKSVLGPSF